MIGTCSSLTNAGLNEDANEFDEDLEKIR